MKKLFYLLLVAATFTFAACGNKKADEEAKRVADSIEQARVADSILQVEQAAELQRIADSTAAAEVEAKRVADSIAAAVPVKGAKKPAAKKVEVTVKAGQGKG